jgi:hypothetical protein
MATTRQSDRISCDIPADTMTRLVAGIGAMQSDLAPFMVELGPDDRRALPKMGPKTIDFVARTLDHMRANPDLKPAYVDLDGLAIDLAAVGQLRSLLTPLQQIVDLLDDSLTLSASEAYGAALICYQNAKGAARLNEPGAKIVADDLARQFAGRGTRTDLAAAQRSSSDPSSR